MDTGTLEFFARAVEVVCTIEDHVLHNGFGCAVMEHLHSRMIKTPVVRIGWPDQFIEHGAVPILTEKAWHHSRGARGKSASAPSQKIQLTTICSLISEGRLRFRKRPPYSMAISRILSGRLLSQDDHSSQPTSRECPARFRAPWCDDTRGSIGPAALPLFCLAPHGVFPASRIAPRAVSSYLAFSPLPALLPKNGGIFSVTLSVTALLRMRSPAYSTRHAAVWCSDFPPASLAASPAIICHRKGIYHNQECRKAGRESRRRSCRDSKR